MKIKTSELYGVALDYAVSKCEEIENKLQIYQVWANAINVVFYGSSYFVGYRPSSDWSHGGPIIDRKKIALDYPMGRCFATVDEWVNSYDGPTPLIAAMRCYVASKLGEEVDIPEELYK